MHRFYPQKATVESLLDREYYLSKPCFASKPLLFSGDYKFTWKWTSGSFPSFTPF